MSSAPVRIEIFDPPMCCPSGLCGPDVDPALLDINEALLHLKKQSGDKIQVDRWVINQNGRRFVEVAPVREMVRKEGVGALPITTVNGEIVKRGTYPSLQELLGFAGLKPEPRFHFFSGKGGVGKTSLAAATAVAEASKGRNTLIVTTDPASNLADIFEQTIGHAEVPIHGLPNLRAMEIDPDVATEAYRERALAPLRELLPEDSLAVVEEQFRSPCATEIAAFDAFTDLLVEAAYDVIVFDTAPTGHTLRLLELPFNWTAHIESSAQGLGQTCIGPVDTLEASKEKYRKAIATLQGPDTRFVLVTQPEETPMYETRRAATELMDLGIPLGEVIINGVIPESEAVHPFFAKRRQAQLEQITRFEEWQVSKPLPKRLIHLQPFEIRGIAALREVASLFDHRVAEEVPQ